MTGFKRFLSWADFVMAPKRVRRCAGMSLPLFFAVMARHDDRHIFYPAFHFLKTSPDPSPDISGWLE
jgi:hypothetical protein